MKHESDLNAKMKYHDILNLQKKYVLHFVLHLPCWVDFILCSPDLMVQLHTYTVNFAPAFSVRWYKKQAEKIQLVEKHLIF